MKIIVISTQPPQRDGKGYAIRAASLIAALEREHEVSVFYPTPSWPRRIAAGIADLVAGLPAQVGFCMPRRDWARAKHAAAGADVALVVTVRALRGPLPIPLILDHVDALSHNWEQRARGPEGIPRRILARLEAGRLRRWEQRAASWSAAQLILTETDVGALPPFAPVHVVEHVVALDAPSARERDIDVVFTGNMRYPPNRMAAQWLDREIAPQIRRQAPEARIVVAGRDADALRLRAVEILSNVPSIAEVLARSRVAIVPLAEMVSGVPTKGLEAAACGAALVLTPSAGERLGLPARVAGDASGLAAQAAALLADPAERTSLADDARAAVMRRGVEQVAEKLDRVLADIVAARQGAAV